MANTIITQNQPKGATHNTSTEKRDTRDTNIQIDLKEELTSEELTKFLENAGDKSATEHFLDITLRNKPHLIADHIAQN